MKTESLCMYVDVDASGPPGVLVFARVLSGVGDPVLAVACRARYRVRGTEVVVVGEVDMAGESALREVLGWDVSTAPEVLAGAPDIGPKAIELAPRVHWGEQSLSMHPQRIALHESGDAVVDYLLRCGGEMPSAVRVSLGTRRRSETRADLADTAMAWPFRRDLSPPKGSAPPQNAPPAMAPPVTRAPSGTMAPQPSAARRDDNTTVEPRSPVVAVLPPMARGTPAPPPVTAAFAPMPSAVRPEPARVVATPLPHEVGSVPRAALELTPSTVRPSMPPPESERPLHRAELLWSGDDADAMTTAKKWTEEGHGRQRTVLRRGNKALQRPVSHAWFAAGRASTPEDLRALSIFDGDEAALTVSAVVVRGELTVDTPAVDELEAVRNALSCVSSRHAAIREALAASSELQPSTLTATEVVQAALDQLYAAARASGMRVATMKENARRALSRARRHAELCVFGEDHVVVRIALAEHSVVAYLPKTAAGHLPLDPCFDVRAVVAVHPRQDPIEEDSVALRICALARIHRDPDAVPA